MGKSKKLIDLSQKQDLRLYINHSIHYLCKVNGGIKPFESVIIAARPGCGKTSLMLNIATSFNIDGLKILFFSCEMTGEEIASYINRTLQVCKETRMNPENFWVNDKENIDIKYIESQIKELKPNVVFIDYIQLLEGSIKENSKGIKKLAKKYQVPFFTAAQLNREAGKKNPDLTMIKDCGGIEQDADEVWFITEDYIEIAKNRKGATGKIPCYFDKENSGTFITADPENYVELQDRDEDDMDGDNRDIYIHTELDKIWPFIINGKNR